MQAAQRLLKRASFWNRFATTIAVKQLLGPLSQHSADFSAFSSDSWNNQPVVAGRLVPHPSNHRSLGTLLDRDALRPGDRPASYRSGMIGDSTGQAGGNIGVVCMKGQERDHNSQEVLDVFGLGLVTAFGSGFLALGVGLGGTLGFQFGSNPLNGLIPATTIK
jgi:hypothetical protein